MSEDIQILLKIDGLFYTSNTRQEVTAYDYLRSQIGGNSDHQQSNMSFCSLSPTIPNLHYQSSSSPLGLPKRTGSIVSTGSMGNKRKLDLKIQTKAQNDFDCIIEEDNEVSTAIVYG